MLEHYPAAMLQNTLNAAAGVRDLALSAGPPMPFQQQSVQQVANNNVGGS